MAILTMIACSVFFFLKPPNKHGDIGENTPINSLQREMSEESGDNIRASQ
jgi:hypothetical protein